MQNVEQSFTVPSATVHQECRVTLVLHVLPLAVPLVMIVLMIRLVTVSIVFVFLCVKHQHVVFKLSVKLPTMLPCVFVHHHSLAIHTYVASKCKTHL